MELVSFAKELIQNAAEQMASCRLGQAALRHADRALWVVEKCARWAVPPPLDQDDKPQPELVRPLPWVFFLAMLVALRLTRESISFLNLILGKPPLRSADVVMYIQSKRRYLRTLKYQGNRMQRARRAPGAEPWYSRVQALFAFTMCFRRSQHYGNNNTITNNSNNDQVLVVRRGKRARDNAAAVTSGHEVTMEQLIEKMMVDLDADSDDDSSFTLTNATSVRSDEDSESDQETITNPSNTLNNTTDEIHSPPHETESNQTPDTETNNIGIEEQTHEVIKTEEIENGSPESDQIYKESPQNNSKDTSKTDHESPKLSPKKSQEKLSPKEETKNFIQSEKCDKPSTQKQKFGRSLADAFNKTFSKREKVEFLANGRAMSVPNKKKGLMNQRRDNKIPLARANSADEAF